MPPVPSLNHRLLFFLEDIEEEKKHPQPPFRSELLVIAELARVCPEKERW